MRQVACLWANELAPAGADNGARFGRQWPPS